MKSADNIAETSEAKRTAWAIRFVAEAFALCAVPLGVQLRGSSSAPRASSHAVRFARSSVERAWAIRFVAEAFALCAVPLGVQLRGSSSAPRASSHAVRFARSFVERAWAIRFVAEAFALCALLAFATACSSVTKSPEAGSALKESPVPVFRMARTGDIEGLQRLKQTGSDLDHPNEIGVTPLMVAARFAQLATVEMLLGVGAKADRVDRDNQGVLHYALGAEVDDTQIRLVVARLLKAGADPFQADKLGLIPIRVFIEENWLDIIQNTVFNLNPKKQCDRMILRPGEMSFAKQARKLGHIELAEYLDSIGCW